MEQIKEKLPDISSITGIMFYSFISYWLIFALSIVVDRLMFSGKSNENTKMKKIIKARDVKKQQADKLLKKIDNVTK
ncbi:unnamed protein product (macronuclear) [Paramecium tetraurelia]|uniref:Uncharacterized protein n=1 Tax=Paramecium tetraurelia TaxID=5888 RepID=A0E9D2_PARTE|nr:uncharacterized protein GSPATT00024630001 [Paramecium tetraurelia]CAK91899.1 unnamed protein product [Paramecium tetraurelia]|eukprot:XP_001459296.1 hypothetical protein (macronuclear) [Paramecium tetraurelia strain d4-2]